ncbi:MAG: YIP1 family protein [Saprospiraceae bacterium]|nr:YIP1 family protein [Saprospiraceae bacterium]
MKTFSTLFFRCFHAPKSALEELLRSPNFLRYGFFGVLIAIAGYTAMYIFLTIGHGAPSVFTPWLNISRDEYYAFNRYLLAPSMLLCWFSAGSLVQLLGRLAGGRGTYEQSMATIGLSIGVAMCFGLLHDLPMSFFSAMGVIDARQHEIDMNNPTIWRTLLWSAYLLYFVAFLVLFPLAVRITHRLSWGRSIALGLLSFVVFQLVFLIFNR